MQLAYTTGTPMTVNPTPFGRPRFNIHVGSDTVKDCGTVVATEGGVGTVSGLSADTGDIVSGLDAGTGDIVSGLDAGTGDIVSGLDAGTCTV